MSLTVEKCLEAWTNSLKQLKLKADIVFFGDSLTYFGDFTLVFPHKRVCNLGLRGDTLDGMIKRVEQIQLLKPDTVYLMAGINDVSSSTIVEFGARYENLIKAIINCTTKSDIILQSLLPVNDNEFSISCSNVQIMECNKVINTLAYKYSFRLINLFSVYSNNKELSKDYTIDGIHLKQPAYERWYEELRRNEILSL